MEAAIKPGVNVHGLRVHLGNGPAVLQQLVDAGKILVFVDVRLFCQIAAVADVDHLLHRFPPSFTPGSDRPKIRERPERSGSGPSPLVRPTGFEPTTFRVGVIILPFCSVS